MKNKILSFMVAICFALTCAITLVSCGGNNDDETNAEARVMTVSLNPELEFILDENGAVVSVSANNDEGNFVISVASDNFTGKSAEDAVTLFLNIAKENGYIVGESNNVSIEISGEDAQKLFDSVNAKIESISFGDGIKVSLSFEAIDADYLKDALEECMVTEDEISGKTDAELIQMLKELRDEANELGLNTEELKETYFTEKYFAEKRAEISSFIETFASSNETLTELLSTLDNYIESISNDFQSISVDGTYLEAMDAYIVAKKQLLQARLDGSLSESQLQLLEDAVTTTQNEYEAQKTALKASMDTFKTQAELSITSLEATINTVKQALGSTFDSTALESAIETKISEFKTSFKNTYASMINSNTWDNLNPKVQEPAIAE